MDAGKGAAKDPAVGEPFGVGKEQAPHISGGPFFSHQERKKAEVFQNYGPAFPERRLPDRETGFQIQNLPEYPRITNCSPANHNAVAPGLILPPPGAEEGYLEKLARRIPMGRPGSVEDVTGAVLYLVDAPYVTGQVLFVDGGQFLDGSVYG